MRVNVLKNTASLYVMNIAKLIFPLITLPYLTRVFSIEAYGVVSYAKALMSYMQIFVDFGFILSATKEIVVAQKDNKAICRIVGDTLVAKSILGGIGFILTLICASCIPILRENFLFTILMYVPIVLTIFLADFLFQGLEKMHILTIRFVIMRLISTVLTFLVVKSDSDLVWIPILDILGNFTAVLITWNQMRKMEITIICSGLKSAVAKLKDSAVYFLSNMASTAFSALNTLLIGIFVQADQVALWSVVMQIVNAVQALYTPITNGIYPEMIKKKELKFLYTISVLFLPIILVGCAIVYWGAEIILMILGGSQYVTAVPLLRAFIFLLIFSFYAMLYGWPALGAIGRTKETSTTTVVTALLQVLGLLILLISNRFTIINLALLRGGTEGFMFLFRFTLCHKYRKEFVG